MMNVLMRVRAIGMGISCAWLVAGACVPVLPGFSEFDEFSITRFNTSRPPFNTSPSSCDIPAGLSVFSASIRRQATGEYSVAMEVSAGEFGAVDPEAGVCSENEQLWLTADGEEGCAALIELPPRLLTGVEVDQMLAVFQGVQLDGTAALVCTSGNPQRKCITSTFVWDGFSLGDFPCLLGSYPIDDSSSSEILLLLQQFTEE